MKNEKYDAAKARRGRCEKLGKKLSQIATMPKQNENEDTKSSAGHKRRSI
jgi:hypothetical protein